MTHYPHPHQYPKRILLAVIGLTPQIVTETLYKLAVAQQPPFIPTEVHLITTKEGAASAKVALFGTGQDKGWFYRLCDDYQLDAICFTESMIHVIRDPEGEFLNDNESTEHNRIAADFITEKVKHFTQAQDTALHVSLAGGRKTMSYYAGYALSLYGRLQDRLSHVLVSQVFMNNKDFFYPRPKEKARRLEVDKRFYSTENAKIILADIPYVRMRYQVPTALLEGSEGFQATVHKIEQFNQLPHIILYPYKNTLECNGILIPLASLDFSLYYYFCKRILADKPALVIHNTGSISQLIRDFLLIYSISELSADYERIESLLNQNKQQETAQETLRRYKQQKKWLSDAKGRLTRKIKKKLGDFAEPFLIKSIRNTKDKTTVYQLNIVAECIKVKYR